MTNLDLLLTELTITKNNMLNLGNFELEKQSLRKSLGGAGGLALVTAGVVLLLLGGGLAGIGLKLKMINEQCLRKSLGGAGGLALFTAVVVLLLLGPTVLKNSIPWGAGRSAATSGIDFSTTEVLRFRL